MTMGMPALDYQGSGALSYLSAEAMKRYEIQLVLPTWSQYVPQRNRVSQHEFAITQSFEARRNLQNVIEGVRSHMIPQLSDADWVIAQQALARLRARQGEEIDSWAQALAADLAHHRD
jgi:hypothetical protein